MSETSLTVEREYKTEDKVRIILSWLFIGGTVEINGVTYQMSDDHDICTVGGKLELGKGKSDFEPCLLRAFLDVKTFIDLCDKVPNDQVMEIAANTALTKFKWGEDK